MKEASGVCLRQAELGSCNTAKLGEAECEQPTKKKELPKKQKNARRELGESERI